MQLRAHGEVHGWTTWLDGGRYASSCTARRGLAKGQTAIFYDGGADLGSTTIGGAPVSVADLRPDCARRPLRAYASPNRWRFNSGGRVDSGHDPV